MTLAKESIEIKVDGLCVPVDVDQLSGLLLDVAMAISMKASAFVKKANWSKSVMYQVYTRTPDGFWMEDVEFSPSKSSSFHCFTDLLMKYQKSMRRDVRDNRDVFVVDCGGGASESAEYHTAFMRSFLKMKQGKVMMIPNTFIELQQAMRL